MNARLLVFVGLVMAIFGMEALLLAKIAWALIRRERVAPFVMGPVNTLVHGLAIAGGLCVFYGRYIEPQMIAVEEIAHTSPDLGGPVTIAHLSDLHLRPEIDSDAEILEAVRAAAPDVIVLTGDYLSERSEAARLRTLFREFAEVAPTYAVKGNWDSWFWADIDMFSGTGVGELDGEVVELRVGPDVIEIGGVAVRNENAAPRVVRAFHPERLNVFAYHSPDLVEEFGGQGVDVYLGGHTHGGQVRLPIYGALITFSKFDKKYEIGRHQVGETTLYVNRGLGTEGNVPPLRFFSVPEVAIHRFAAASGPSK